MQLSSLLGKPRQGQISVGIVGAGEFGRTFLSQARRVPGLKARVACDRDIERGVQCFASSGIAPEVIVVCDNTAEAARALETGKCVVVQDAGLLSALPLDLVVEATGDPELESCPPLLKAARVQRPEIPASYWFAAKRSGARRMPWIHAPSAASETKGL